MPPVGSNTQIDLDPLEVIDEEEANETDETAPEATGEAETAEPAAIPELGEDIEMEIKQVMLVEEESPAKQKNHMIPRDLIDQELRWEDLLDDKDGSI